MNILLVGPGGREHALAWKIAHSPSLTRLVCAPGNPGMAALGESAAGGGHRRRRAGRPGAGDRRRSGGDRAGGGVEAGLADALAEAGIACFGPTAAAGRLETSKAFTKAFADRHGLPTGRLRRVRERRRRPRPSLDRFTPPYVIKADGLAAGKGVVIADDRAEAEAAIDDMLGGRFGAAGARVVIEEFLDGEIASLFALCDGRTSLLFGGGPGPQARLRRRRRARTPAAWGPMRRRRC